MTAALTHQDWLALAAKLDIATGLFIDGAYRPAWLAKRLIA